MNIYRIDPITEEFGLLELNSKAITEVFGDLGYDDLRELEDSVADEWPQCSGAFYDMYSEVAGEITNTPDIYIWNGCFLALSAQAKLKLESKLKIFGEFLPFNCRGENHYLFSSYSIVDEDPATSEELIENGAPMGIKSLSFPAEDVGTKPIFKTEFDNFDHLYCSESFKETLLNSGLTLGATFSSDLSHRRPV